MSEAQPTIAILYPGEMGAAIAAVLRKRGLRVVTSLRDRSAATVKRCREDGIEVLASLSDVTRAAKIVFSIVPPAAAQEIAAAYVELAQAAPADAIFVDGNSIAPESAYSVSQMVAKTGHGFVDAAINGLAKNLTTSGTLFLSGQRAAEIAALFEGAVRVRNLGEEVGAASMMKMLLAGMSKGLCALFTELALVARRADMLGALLEESTRIYPGVMAVIDRMLPTYAQHAGRRATEMAELHQTAQSTGVDPCVITAVQQLHEKLADVPFGSHSDSQGTVSSLIERLIQEGILSPAALVSAGKHKE